VAQYVALWCAVPVDVATCDDDAEVLFDVVDEPDDFEAGEWEVVFGVLLVLWPMPPDAECVEDVVPLDVLPVLEEYGEVECVEDCVPLDVLPAPEECADVDRVVDFVPVVLPVLWECVEVEGLDDECECPFWASSAGWNPNDKAAANASANGRERRTEPAAAGETPAEAMRGALSPGTLRSAGGCGRPDGRRKRIIESS
jgi:hypothetical protein